MYPVITYTEWTIYDEPCYFETEKGNGYYLFSISRTYGKGEKRITVGARVEACGECARQIYHWKKRYGTIKGEKINAVAEQIPVRSEREPEQITNVYRAIRLEMDCKLSEQRLKQRIREEQEREEMELKERERGWQEHEKEEEEERKKDEEIRKRIEEEEKARKEYVDDADLIAMLNGWW